MVKNMIYNQESMREEERERERERETCTNATEYKTIEDEMS